MNNKQQLYIIGLVIGVLFIFSGCNISDPDLTPVAATVAPTSVSVAQPVTEIHFVVGTSPESPEHQYVILVFTEAFKRLGITFYLEQVPLNRAAEMVTQGLVDGEAHRIYDYLEAGNYPNHIRVEEAYIQNVAYAFVTNDEIVVDGDESIAGENYRLGYLRGVKRAEDNLRKVTIPDNIFVVDSIEHGFDMLLSDRIDILIYSLDLLPAELQEAGVRNAGIFERGLLHPFMHKKHAELAPKLAEVLREMKAEGLLKQYDQQLGLTWSAD